MHTITASNGAGSINPIAVEGYTPSRQSRNVIHDLLDGSIGVSYIAPRPRSGQLRMLFSTETDAFEALSLLGEECSFVYSNTDIVSVGMEFALDNSVDMELDASVGNWWVTTGFQEVS